MSSVKSTLRASANAPRNLHRTYGRRSTDSSRFKELYCSVVQWQWRNSPSCSAWWSEQIRLYCFQYKAGATGVAAQWPISFQLCAGRSCRDVNDVVRKWKPEGIIPPETSYRLVPRQHTKRKHQRDWQRQKRNPSVCSERSQGRLPA